MRPKTSSGKSYFLGLDGGGTKTDCVLLDEIGRVRATSVSGPSNPQRSGFREACAAVKSAADEALRRGRVKSGQIRGFCAGLAGAGNPAVARRVAGFLRKSFPSAMVQVTTDLEIALRAAVDNGEGVVLISGTGSAAFGRNASGKTARAGGRGPHLGDEGSAFDIGRRAMEEVVRAKMRSNSLTRLSNEILAAFRVRDWNALTRRAARKPDEVYPKIFPVVVRTAERGNTVAQKILVGAAVALADIAESVIEQLHLTRKTFRLAKAGGVFGRSAILDGPLDAQLRKLAPRVRIVSLKISLARAAAEMARLQFREVLHDYGSKRSS